MSVVWETFKRISVINSEHIIIDLIFILIAAILYTFPKIIFTRYE